MENTKTFDNDPSVKSLQAKVTSLERRVHRLTMDSVTHLLKKEGIIDKILEGDESIANVLSGPVAILSIDFDKFKEVNDTYGHKMGDLYLRETCSEIDRYAWGEGENIGFAFRGKEGDEIVAVLRVINNDPTEYEKRVTVFCNMLNLSLKSIGNRLPSLGINRTNPSISIGAVFKPEGISAATPSETLGNLLEAVDKEADAAVYVTKNRKTTRPEDLLVDVTFFEKLNPNV